MKVAVIPVTPIQQNCSLLWEEGATSATVVDPGGDVPRILAEVARLGLTVEQIVLTHGHVDHAGGAAELKAAAGGVPVIGPDERDRFLLDDLANSGRAFGIPGRPVTPDRWLTEGDTLAMAGQQFAVLHCPGHTPGSVVLASRAARFALVGDVLFRGSVGRTDFPYGDEAALLRSIHAKLLPLGDDMTFLCGHGPGSTLGAERAGNPFLQGAPP